MNEQNDKSALKPHFALPVKHGIKQASAPSLVQPDIARHEESIKRRLFCQVLVPHVTLFLIVLLTCSVHADERGPGYAIFKTSKANPDSTAEIRELTKFETFPTLSRLHTTAGGKIELKAGAFCAYIPDPKNAHDPAATLELVKGFQQKFPHLDSTLSEIVKVCEARLARIRNLPANKHDSAATAVKLMLNDGSKFEGKDVGIISTSADSMKVGDASGIHLVNFEQIDLSRSSLPAPLPAKVEAFNNPHILFKRANELLETRDADDATRAIALLEKAAQQNHRKAQFTLGMLYREGAVTPRNLQLAKSNLSKAAESGIPEAMVTMGAEFSGTPEEALSWFDRAARLGSYIAALKLGNAYLEGAHFPKDEKKAFEFFKAAAEKGVVEAQMQLGSMYLQGMGVERDVKQAFEWSLKAAQGGNAAGQFNVGVHYRQGLGVEKDALAAHNWLVAAANQGYAPAQILAGISYLDETNLLPDIKDQRLAAYYLKLAAEQGAPDAQFLVANFYVSGEGVAIDYRQAERWYLAAANQCHGAAQIGLALLYSSDVPGVPLDLEKSRLWCDRAAATGDTYKTGLKAHAAKVPAMARELASILAQGNAIKPATKANANALTKDELEMYGDELVGKRVELVGLFEEVTDTWVSVFGLDSDVVGFTVRDAAKELFRAFANKDQFGRLLLALKRGDSIKLFGIVKQIKGNYVVFVDELQTEPQNQGASEQTNSTANSTDKLAPPPHASSNGSNQITAKELETFGSELVGKRVYLRGRLHDVDGFYANHLMGDDSYTGFSVRDDNSNVFLYLFVDKARFGRQLLALKRGSSIGAFGTVEEVGGKHVVIVDQIHSESQ